MDAIDWLLEDDSPGVQFLARRLLLGESPRSRSMKALRQKCNGYPPVALMLERLGEALSGRYYKKYQGAYWTLIFLAEMQADESDPRIGRLAERVLEQQGANGGFAFAKRGFEIVCLTANLLRSLVHFGYGEYEGVVRGYRRLAERILSNDGVPCSVVRYGPTLMTTCKMTLPQTLRCVAVVPSGVPRGEADRLRELLVGQLLDIRVYRYVRPDARSFKKEVLPRKPNGTTVHDFRDAYLAEHPVRPAELLPKKGWLRFGFPTSYNPDLLEAMLALAEAGAEPDPVLDEALDHIESRRGEDGRWKLEVSPNGKMLADVEKKGQPSKWITLRALTVLKHFGRLD